MNLKGRNKLSFDSLEILQLKGYLSTQEILRNDFQDPSENGIEAIHICTPEEATSFISLWNTLPDSYPARCHMPGFAVRVTKENQVDFVATICWQCDNIYIEGNEATESSLYFKGDSRSGKRFLQFCQSLFA